MMLAELHCHTGYSRKRNGQPDGLHTPEQMVRQAKTLGLQAIAITDHDTLAGLKAAVPAGRKHGILVIPGCEISSSNGHILALGIDAPVKPGLPVAATVEQIRAQNGLSIAAHPFDFRRRGVGTLARHCDAIEAFNAMSLERIPNLRARWFASQESKPGTAGSDAHSRQAIGMATVRLEADSLDALLQALRRGRFSTAARYMPLNLAVADMLRKRWRPAAI
ncbi:MAG: PHP domain-containing protein [Candidatus Aenigmarchaeota archaeon]|nr:PHP domain-containing protein [Candidatus Aenigmarchaeota archaeon]